MKTISHHPCAGSMGTASGMSQNGIASVLNGIMPPAHLPFGRVNQMKIICAKCKKEMVMAHHDGIIAEGPAKVFYHPCTCMIEEINRRIRAIIDSVESDPVTTIAFNS